MALDCIADGIPIPSVEWIFYDIPLSDQSFLINNYTLNVQSIRDAGNYTCVAQNEHGNISEYLTLSVQGIIIVLVLSLRSIIIILYTPIDPPLVTVSPIDINGTAYDSITLNCTAYGYPVPDIEWLKDNISLFNETDSSAFYDEKYTIWSTSMSDDDSYETTSYITISVLSYDDNGLYQCIAFNSLVTVIEDISNASVIDVKCKLFTKAPIINNYYKK